MASWKPNHRIMASDHDPRNFPFYSGESGVKQAYDVRGPSRGNTGVVQNMLRGQVSVGAHLGLLSNRRRLESCSTSQ